MKRYFVTAAGTGIGKTLVTCALAHQLNARALKPVISGFDPAAWEESDTALLLKAQNLPLTQEAAQAISPWRFKTGLSPDMAAAEEGRSIDMSQLLAFCRAQQGEPLFIEGVGGVLVPLNDSATVLDWMRALGYPVILVGGSYLGSLNHTLLSASAIAQAGLPLQGLVISESERPAASLKRTCASLKPFLPEGVPLCPLPRLDSSPELWKDVPDLTESLHL